MKSIIKKAVFVFICALTFLVAGTLTVKAADRLDNTKISNYAANFSIEEEKYYLVDGNSSNASIQLNSIKNTEHVNWFRVPYVASVSIVKCEKYDSENGCSDWNVYNYSSSREDTNDALVDGMKLKFDGLKPGGEITSINGASLATLKSAYGVQNTYFVIVQYTRVEYLGGLFGFEQVDYAPEIFKVVLSEELEGVNITHTLDGNVAKIKVTSATPINTIKYFSSSEELSAGFDFEDSYNASESGKVELEAAQANGKFENGKFVYEFSISLESGKHYYISATDVADSNCKYDLTKGSSTTDAGVAITPNDNNDGNVGNEDIGKIILISLLVVLVLSLVLVIVQRIVDYRKKLY